VLLKYDFFPIYSIIISYFNFRLFVAAIIYNHFIDYNPTAINTLFKTNPVDFNGVIIF
jgi:hypothetical protein